MKEFVSESRCTGEELLYVGQARDRLSQNPHTRVHRVHLHGGALIDRPPRRCRAEQERVARRELRVGGTAPKPISYGPGASFANVW